MTDALLREYFAGKVPEEVFVATDASARKKPEDYERYILRRHKTRGVERIRSRPVLGQSPPENTRIYLLNERFSF
jgi:hypothetical protein